MSIKYDFARLSSSLHSDSTASLYEGRSILRTSSRSPRIAYAIRRGPRGGARMTLRDAAASCPRIISDR